MREDFSILPSELHLKIQVKKYNFHFFSKEATFCENAPKCIISISPNVHIFYFILPPPTPALCDMLDLSSPNRD